MTTQSGCTRSRRQLLAWATAFLVALAFLFSWNATAQISVPALSGRVVDQTGTLNRDQKAALEQTLQAFEARKGSQVAVLLVPTTEPETIEQFSLRVAEQWKLGRKKVDDGALLIVAKNDRTLRIEVGYGLEGALSDLVAKRIVSDVIVPRFKQQDFAGGIAAGVDQMLRVIDGEALPPPRAASRSSSLEDLEQYAPILFVLAMVAGGVLRAMLGRFPGALVTGGLVAALAWFLVGVISIALIAGVIALVVTLFGGGRGFGGFGGGHYGGHSGSSGSFGGGSFGGGGGSFGGGGASGRW